MCFFLGGAAQIHALPQVGGYGGIFFFPNLDKRPTGDIFQVKSGQEIEVCVLLKSQGAPLIEQILQGTTGFRLILEDEQTPPNAIDIEAGNGDAELSKTPEGCYQTTFQIPRETEPGKYQVANLLFQMPGGEFFSIREYLYGFSVAEELQVENSDFDTEAPKLVQVSAFNPGPGKIKTSNPFATIKLKQYFQFEDPQSGIDKGTLKVFYRLYEEGQFSSTFPAQCKKVFGKNDRFRCVLTLRRPKFQWALKHLALELESIYVNDKSGNFLFVVDPKKLPENVRGGPLIFEYVGEQKKISNEPPIDASPKNQSPESAPTPSPSDLPPSPGAATTARMYN